MFEHREDRRRVDLAVICHSVEEDRAAAVAFSLLRVNPEIRVIRLTTENRTPRDCFDRLVASLEPGVLLATVEQILTVGITSFDQD